MKLIISKGKHRPAWWWLRWPIWYNKSTISYSVKFSSSCEYDLRHSDQDDTNKLFGIGYFPHHRLESARIGWRFDAVRNKMVLSAYAYVDGIRYIEDIQDVFIDTYYVASIVVKKNKYEFRISRPDIHIDQIVYIPKQHSIKLAYPLGLYFGGNQLAPHEMAIQLKRI